MSAENQAQQDFDLVFAGGRVIDPRNDFDGIADVAVSGGRIAAVGQDLARNARQVRDAAGLIVAPGLIDLHTHVYHKATSLSVDPVMIAGRSAVATLVDAGSAGAGNFDGLRDYIIAPCPVRVLAYLNISFAGIFAFDRAVSFGEASVEELLNVERCVEVIGANRELIVGVKVRIGGGTSGDLGLAALDRAMEAAERTGLPVMSHIGGPPPSYAELVDRLRPGDILTHCYRPQPNALVELSGDLLPAVLAARKRGVLFDIGHGMGAFSFDSADAAVAGGFLPDVASSDVHVLCVDGPAYDLLHTMSKLMACGVDLPEVIRMATDAPARALRRDDIGHLGIGAPADVSLIEVVETPFSFVDVVGVRREGGTVLRGAGLCFGGEMLDLPAGPRPVQTR